MEGQIKFFDENLTLVNWLVKIGSTIIIMFHNTYILCRYDRLNCGPIVSISFAFNTTLSKLTK